MSQRFGRNQRRRAREQIAALQSAHVLDRKLSRHLSKKLEAVRAELDEAKELAGSMSILFPATETIEVGFKSTDGRKIQVVPINTGPSSFSSASPPCFQIMELDTIVAKITTDKLSRSIHARVEFADQVWGYGIAETAWHSMSREQREHKLLQEIPKQLAREMAKFEFNGRAYGR